MAKRDEKIIYYPISEEKINNPEFQIENRPQIPERTVDIICEYTGISRDKLLFFIERLGLSKVLDEPALIGLDPENEQKFKELKILLGEE